MRELARLRNEAARTLGFRDWFALSVATSEMDETRLFETLDECDRLTGEAFATWKAATDARLAERFGCAPSELRPWHYEDPFFQEVPAAGGVDLTTVFADADVVELARATFAAIGIDTAPILGRSDLFSRDGKCQHAFCIDVDREGDVRVLANVEPDRYWADTMLHELGHGAYDIGFDGSLSWLLRDCHLTMTEGIAILMGRLAQEAEWLREVAGVDADEAERLDGPLQAALAAELLVFTRWVLVMTNFERAFYADPEADLDATWWDLVARYQLLTPPEGRGAPDWAAKIHVACAPVYYHTYLYGNLVACQLRATIDARAGRPRRAARGGSVPRGGGLPPRPVRALGRAARAGDRRAADRGARRPVHRARPRGGSLVKVAVGLNHVSVVARDLEESTRFYEEVLGLERVADAGLRLPRAVAPGGRPAGAPLRAGGRSARRGAPRPAGRRRGRRLRAGARARRPRPRRPSATPPPSCPAARPSSTCATRRAT